MVCGKYLMLPFMQPQGRATPGSNQPDKMYNLAITRDKPAVPSNTKLAIWGVQLFDPDDEAQGLDSRVDLSTAADEFNEFTHSTWRVQGNVTVDNLAQKIRAALKRSPDPEQTDHMVDLEDCYVSDGKEKRHSSEATVSATKLGFEVARNE